MLKEREAQLEAESVFGKKQKRAFLQDVVATVEMEEIPAVFILHWDQTGIKFVLSSNLTMEVQ